MQEEGWIRLDLLQAEVSQGRWRAKGRRRCSAYPVVKSIRRACRPTSRERGGGGGGGGGSSGSFEP